MRLIDADKMRDDWLENGENEYVYDTNAVLESIDEQPTVDAAPVVHGHWKYEPYEFGYKKDIKCSECYCYVATETDYCPYCGAKMDGKDDT
jgi:hypothetical protein